MNDDKQALERRVEGAQARLIGRIEEVGRRVEKVKDAIDVAQTIRAHPLTAVGIGLAAGALLGLPRPGMARRLSGELGAMLTAVALHVARTQLTAWVDDQLVAGADGVRPGAVRS